MQLLFKLNKEIRVCEGVNVVLLRKALFVVI